MSWYSILRPLLFSLEPETAHHFTLEVLRGLHKVALVRDSRRAAAGCERTVMGIRFPNPVGLAAGLDKNGEYIDALSALGFGFIEIGTVTPRPQRGNPPPRLFRLSSARAIINRLGFNNDGVDKLVENVRSSAYRGVLGINIGKNADTPLERAVDDYVQCLRKVFAVASYVTVNISSPNTRGLRTLQEGNELDRLLAILKQEQHILAQKEGRRVPLAVKIAPDLDGAQVRAVAGALERHAIDAVIATNTTLARDDVTTLKHATQAGGLSGGPLKARATTVLAELSRALGGAIPVIGVGGIMSAPDAAEKVAAGAQLVQLYTGLVYHGPQLVHECVRELCGAP